MVAGVQDCHSGQQCKVATGDIRPGGTSVHHPQPAIQPFIPISARASLANYIKDASH